MVFHFSDSFLDIILENLYYINLDSLETSQSRICIFVGLPPCAADLVTITHFLGESRKQQEALNGTCGKQLCKSAICFIWPYWKIN